MTTALFTQSCVRLLEWTLHSYEAATIFLFFFNQLETTVAAGGAGNIFKESWQMEF